MRGERRVHHPDAAAEPGTELELDRDEAHHLRRVLRLGPGDVVRVFDAAGHEREAVLAAVGSRVVVRLGAAVLDPVEAPLEIVLFQGSCRTDRMEWVIQKATELGVAAIRPAATRRAEAPAPTPQRLGRWRRIALEACKQSGRRQVPRIEPCDELPAPDAATAALLLDPAAALSLGAAAVGPAPRAAWIAVGPEGGFEPAEVDRCTGSGWRAVALGPRVLRTETAGIVAAALVLHAWGDLSRTPAV